MSSHLKSQKEHFTYLCNTSLKHSLIITTIKLKKHCHTYFDGNITKIKTIPDAKVQMCSVKLSLNTKTLFSITTAITEFEA